MSQENKDKTDAAEARSQQTKGFSPLFALSTLPVAHACQTHSEPCTLPASSPSMIAVTRSSLRSPPRVIEPNKQQRIFLFRIALDQGVLLLEILTEAIGLVEVQPR